MAPVTADDVEAATDFVVATLTPHVDDDWSAAVPVMQRDCWDTAQHIYDGLLYYAAQLASARTGPAERPIPFQYEPRSPDVPEGALWADRDAGIDGLLVVLSATGTLLSAVVATSPPDRRAHHYFGRSDPEGFAAMGVIELLVHADDMKDVLGYSFEPDADLCDRVRDRLFPDAPTDVDPWPALLWGTDRIALPGHGRVGPDWGWHSAPR